MENQWLHLPVIGILQAAKMWFSAERILCGSIIIKFWVEIANTAKASFCQATYWTFHQRHRNYFAYNTC